MTYELAGAMYTLEDDQATLLAERLRSYAKGKLQSDIKRASELSGNPHWTEGALAVADFTEELLVGNLDGPLPLEGKAAEATFWALRLMQGLGISKRATDAAALRDALAGRCAAERAALKRAA
ncbi:MAG TPA: hypothetical protein VGH24_09430 [Solirubrobacteraceae bacterium]